MLRSPSFAGQDAGHSASRGFAISGFQLGRTSCPEGAWDQSHGFQPVESEPPPRFCVLKGRRWTSGARASPAPRPSDIPSGRTVFLVFHPGVKTPGFGSVVPSARLIWPHEKAAILRRGSQPNDGIDPASFGTNYAGRAGLVPGERQKNPQVSENLRVKWRDRRDLNPRPPA